MLLNAQTPEQQQRITKIIIEQSEEAGCFLSDMLGAGQNTRENAKENTRENALNNETSQFTLDKIEQCDIDELMQRVILLNQNFADNSKINIACDIDDNLPLLKCDARRMKQILINLMSNAIKYSPANTEIKVVAKYLKSTDQIYIEISDSGIGMAADEIAMALNGNGKAIDKSALNKPIDSHGLGMPIIKQLVELHKGKLEIESEKDPKKNQGTKIKLYFDIDNPDLVMTESFANKEANKKQINTQFLSGKSILIVDDSEVNAMVVTHILSNAGCKIYHVKNGKEALEILDNPPNIDLILMDGEMPIMNGYDATKTIREGKRFKNFKNYNIPIIALMGNDDEKTIKRTKECGMDGHIGKSSASDLLGSIVGCLGKLIKPLIK